MSLGIGVMLGSLGGNKETVEAIKTSLNKTIASVYLDEDKLCFIFSDESKLILWDDGQSCCENRYMATSDDLSEYTDSILLDFELKNAPNIDDEYGEHEVQFLDVVTNKGTFQMANHNEHNGYYGGFWIKASLIKEAV